MKWRNTFQAFFYCLLFTFVLWGCSDNKPVSLDKDDVRFAGFYSDYMLLSGVLDGNETHALSAVNPAELNELLVRHALTRESLTRKTALYKENPELWRAVLVQVRENIRKKSAGGA
ncbi:MAG: hypothetical protein HKK67_05675 [Chlorobiaceae bacterium]|nr:hypothetical protein [Chlorobiaceae bacterium]